MRHSGPPLDKNTRRDRHPSERTKFGHLSTIAGDGQAFPALDPFYDFASMVTQIPDGHLAHATSVSPVRQMGGDKDNHRGCPIVEAPRGLLPLAGG